MENENELEITLKLMKTKTNGLFYRKFILCGLLLFKKPENI